MTAALLSPPTHRPSKDDTMHIDRLDVPREYIPLGYNEIATFLGVEDRTPIRWKQRGHLPRPDGWFSGKRPYWYAGTIAAWAKVTGRGKWPNDDIPWQRLMDLVARRRAEHEAEDRARDVERLAIRIQAMRADLDRVAAAQQTAKEATAAVKKMRRELAELTAEHAAAEEAERQAEVAP